MENTNNPQENKSNGEKTVVFGASAKNDDSNTDKTTINNNADKTEFQSSAANSDKPNTDEKEVSKDSKTISKPDTQKAPTGAFVAAAAVAGAAAGVAAGTIFSEDIKGAFGSETIDAPESPEVESTEVTSSAETVNSANSVETVNASSSAETDHVANNASDIIHASSFEASSTDAQGNTYTVSSVDENSDGHIDIASGEAHMVDGSSVSFTASGDALDSMLNAETDHVSSSVETHHAASSASAISHASSFETSSTDAQGNTYTVSLVDENSDGHIDIASGEAHMVDGSSVSFTASGDALDSMLNNDAGIATASDFESQPEFAHIPGETSGIPLASDTMPYEIQSGDTLSDIAAAHNTSVGDLMELNPEISDPNMIYTGNNLNIPTSDHPGNPYEGSHDQQNNESSVIASNEPVQASDSISLSEEGSFESVDWSSFNDTPVSMDDYSNVLAQSDFDSYEPPSNYLESGNDFVSSEFI